MPYVIITGASRGIGAATAKVFAQKGYDIVLNYCHSQQKAEDLAAFLRKEYHVQVLPMQADVSNPKEAETFIRSAMVVWGTPSVLVNNAGIAQQKLFTDITWEEYQTMMNTNAGGVFSCCKAVLPAMIHEKKGAIVNVSSMWGVSGASCEVHYSASKAAVIGLTKALAKEVGPSGITVNCVAPGVIDTEMNGQLSQETLNGLAEETPLSRLGTPEDIARAIYFLASSDAAFITGQVLTVDGGIL
ncbi:MAG: 3-oxoacyl-ACP reductase FabG [Clostridia bacterium]|nr:3-oxoacyl-ACP reductase FabG [Clostridia bacterium]